MKHVNEESSFHYQSYNSPVRFNDNERSYVIQVISEINLYLRDKNMMIKRAGGERTMNGGSFVKFPDVLLFSDADQSIMLQGWEAKCPDVAIDNEAFVEDAHNKARLLKCNSCVLWNFQYAQLHILNSDNEFEIAERWTIDERIIDRDTITVYSSQWKTFLHSLIDKINEYVSTGRIKHRSLGEALTESLMPTLINENKGVVAAFLKEKAAADVNIAVYISNWWESVKQEYVHDESDPFFAYAKIILISWLNKFLFANIIQTHFEAARLVNSITEGCKIKEAIDYFEVITNKCDFYNVFSFVKYSELLPDITWQDLISFNELLIECDISNLESQYNHKLLEDSINVTKRQIAGQYPTPKPLAQLMSEIAIRNAYGQSWDCCCGTGTIGCSVWARKKEMLDPVENDSAKRAFQTTWMSDIHDFPLQIATQSLSSMAQTSEPLLVFRKDVFQAAEGEELSFVDPKSGNVVQRQLPLFDSIVSNLPFVDFNTSDISNFASAKQLIRDYQLAEYSTDLSDRNDLYSYITLWLDRLLSKDGYACILTSNSWLCTASGEDFMRSLRNLFSIEGIYVNGKNRWFNNADVMNALLVLSKKTSDLQSSVVLGVIEASIEDLESIEIRKAIARKIISHAGKNPYGLIEQKYTWEQIDRLKSLGISYYAMCHNVGFVSKISAKLCQADEQFYVFRGTKSGQDKFFYSSDRDFIEEEYCYDLLKNFREIDSFDLKPNGYAFVCNRSEDELESLGHNKALARIQSIDKINASCRGHRPYWYTLPIGKDFDFATMMGPGGRLFFAEVPDGARFVANQRAICFSPLKKDFNKQLCLALLNSTIGLFFIEASAAPMALGALDTRKETFEHMFMLNPELISEESAKKIILAFEPIKQRKISDTLTEITKEDRIKFDKVVMEAFGLEEYLEDIYYALRSLLIARLS